MSSKILIGLSIVLATTPFANAHLDDTGGYPKPYCEPQSDWEIHDYGPVASGHFLTEFADGSLGDCDNDDLPGDYDGHSEFARGGAWILVNSGDGTYGTQACFAEDGHHPEFANVTVEDLVLKQTAPFTVAADSSSVLPSLPGQPACGDLQADDGMDCIGTCKVTFAPGVDGAYLVFVTGTVGHVIAN